MPDTHALARQLAVTDERKNTMKADLAATLERFRTHMARMSEDVASRQAESSDRVATATECMATSRWWQTAAIFRGLGISTGIIIAAMGWMLQFALSSGGP